MKPHAPATNDTEPSSAALLEAAIADKHAARRRAAERLARAGGDPVIAERLEEEADQADLRARVVAAVAREMGLAAPPEGSPSRDALADRLLHAVNVHSLARVEFFTEAVRTKLYQAYFELENDSGAFDQEWRRGMVVYGLRGLADESDAQLLERLVISRASAYLVDDDGVWLGEDEREFLTAMATREAVNAVQLAAPVLDGVVVCNGAAEVDDLREALYSLGQRYEAHGLQSPYAAMLEVLDSPGTTVPGPQA